MWVDKVRIPLQASLPHRCQDVYQYSGQTLGDDVLNSSLSGRPGMIIQKLEA